MEDLACTHPFPESATTTAAALPALPATAVAAPDERQFRQLVEQHRGRLQAFIVRNIGHRDDAEDLAQQAFAAAASSLHSFRGEAALSTWLYGIAMNLVRNHLSRAPHRRHAFESDSVLDSFAAPGADPFERVERLQLLARLQTELDLLPPEMREVLLLVAVDDLSYEDAAMLLGMPIGTVRSRVSRARSTLRKRFSASGIERPF